MTSSSHSSSRPYASQSSHFSRQTRGTKSSAGSASPSVRLSPSCLTRCRLVALQNLLETKLKETDASYSLQRGVPPCKAIRDLYWVRQPGERLMPGDRLGLLIWQHSMVKTARKLLARHDKKQRRLRLKQSSPCAGPPEASNDNEKPQIKTLESTESGLQLYQHPHGPALSTPSPSKAGILASNHNVLNVDEEYNLPSSDDSDTCAYNNNSHCCALSPNRTLVANQPSVKSPSQRGCRFLCRRVLCHLAANFH